ncbi:primase-like DNA-binding domain-containing protein [Neobacillus sp. NPDC093127]|uniref:primase-like DNA-binding domain-containing protein n=1 Tax=Neobacillus sp. NPDC093127 TaxID=3364296 RepID=UPI0038289F1F
MTRLEKFIQENIERDIKSFEMSDDLYKRYLIFCQTYNLKPLGKKGFASRLSKERIGAWYKSKGKYGRWGVKLLPCKY